MSGSPTSKPGSPRGKVHVGTTGWSYPHWKGPFYHESLKSSMWLEFYADHLHSIEINNSFYRMPSERVFQNWKDRTPETFLFAIKGSRYITHVKKLIDAEQPTLDFLRRVGELGERGGPVLFQLPPDGSSTGTG